MITELIFLIIFILSLCGILLILARKVPVLNSLPQNGSTGIRKHHVILDAENKIKEILISFEKQIIVLYAALNGYLDNIEVTDLNAMQKKLIDNVEKLHAKDVIEPLKKDGKLSPEVEEKLKHAISTVVGK